MAPKSETLVAKKLRLKREAAAKLKRQNTIISPAEKARRAALRKKQLAKAKKK